jgi:hypothetical protein
MEWEQLQLRWREVKEEPQKGGGEDEASKGRDIDFQSGREADRNYLK